MKGLACFARHLLSKFQNSKDQMAKEFDLKCPYCGDVRKMKISDVLRESLATITATAGMRGDEDEKPKPPSPESLDEENWIDLKPPCPECGHRFSLNIVTGETRE